MLTTDYYSTSCSIVKHELQLVRRYEMCIRDSIQGGILGLVYLCTVNVTRIVVIGHGLDIRHIGYAVSITVGVHLSLIHI